MALMLYTLLQVIKYIVIADAFLSFVRESHEFPRNITHEITRPLYAPFHAILNPSKTGGIDLSPIAVIMLIGLAQAMLAGGS